MAQCNFGETIGDTDKNIDYQDGGIFQVVKDSSRINHLVFSQIRNRSLPQVNLCNDQRLRETENRLSDTRKNRQRSNRLLGPTDTADALRPSPPVPKTRLFVDIDNMTNFFVKCYEDLKKTNEDISASKNIEYVNIFFRGGFSVKTRKKFEKSTEWLRHCDLTMNESGEEKNGADYELMFSLFDRYKSVPLDSVFVIVSGDRAFEEIVIFFPGRSVKVVSPHPRHDFTMHDIVETIFFSPGERVQRCTELDSIVSDINNLGKKLEKINFVPCISEMEQRTMKADLNKKGTYNIQFYDKNSLKNEMPFKCVKSKHSYPDSLVFLQVCFALYLHHILDENKHVAFEIISPNEGLEKITSYFKLAGRCVTLTKLESTATVTKKKER